VTLKDLLVHVDQTSGASRRLRLAAGLACRHGSRLTALFVRECSQAQLEETNTAELALASAQETDRLHQRMEASLEDSVERLRIELGRLEHEYRLSTRWLALDGFAADVVVQHARYADVCILGHGGPSSCASFGYTFPEHLLFVSGRPIILVPESEKFATLGQDLAVAWNASRAAARALHDALPLIDRAEHTIVITINPAEIMARSGALPMGELVKHLRRHSGAVEAVEMANVPKAMIAETLQAKALELGCDLLIAGAFGHAKLREKLLGGVTESLLTRAHLPLMMSH
jgi:nucleotide-binding universal stress UspA family protein